MPKAIIRSAYFKSAKHVQNYIKYINKQSAIFTQKGETLLGDSLSEAEKNSKSQFWRQIYSISDEDAYRLGVDRNYMKMLIAKHSDAIAATYNISPDKLRIVASYHAKDHHPHLHMVIYSTNKREGHIHVHNDADRKKILNKASTGLKQLFTNDIFKNDLLDIKMAKGTQRDMINEHLQKTIEQVVKSGYPYDKQITALLKDVSNELADMTGRKFYAYAPPAVKNKIDQILEKIITTDPIANKQYQEYAKLQESLIESYVDNPETIAKKMNDWESRFFSPQKGDDKTRHNMIVKAALQMQKNEVKDKNQYYEKHPGAVTQNLLYGINKSLAAATKISRAQNQAHQPAQRNMKLRKKTHQYDKTSSFIEQ